jgi:glutamate--cysteine ligase
VDIRNAGFKITTVDTNLFPAGFNNLNPDFWPLCVQAFQAALEHVCPGADRVLLVPENHTRNSFYFESLGVIYDVLRQAGFDVRIGSLRDDLRTPETITLASGKTLVFYPIQRVADTLSVGDFKPCMVLLNNDLSDGIPSILEGVKHKMMPPLTLGWSTRLKSVHFTHYQQVAEEFSHVIAMDPWFINPLFRVCDEVDFTKREGEGCLMQQTQSLLDEIQRKYDQYGINHKPFVVIKADSGTYGRGVMTVDTVEQLTHLNRAQRNEMAKTKGSQAIHRVILQEGVYTFETWDDAVAEPVVYMVGSAVVGGFYRVHEQRGINENLNAPGAKFKPLAFDRSCHTPDCDNSDSHINRFYTYGVIGRLAALAAAREIAEKTRK